MAIGLGNYPNIETPDSDYPDGQIKDRAGIVAGTPVNKLCHADYHQFFAKILREAGITPNGIFDNEYSGLQYFEGLLQVIKNTPAYVMDYNSLGNSLSLIGNGNLFVKFPVLVHDTMDWYNITTGAFNPQLEGFYQITVQLNVIPVAITNNTTFDVHLQKNSSGSVQLASNDTLFVSDGAGDGFVNKYKSVSLTKILYFNGSSDQIGVIYNQYSDDNATEVSVAGNIAISRVGSGL